MSLDDFTIICNPIPSGQKMLTGKDLKPFTSDKNNLIERYLDFLDYYNENLSKKTVLIYNDSKYRYQYVYASNDHINSLCILRSIKCFLDLDYHNSNHDGYYKNDGKLHTLMIRENKLNEFIKTLIEYNNWNVVMISGNSRKDKIINVDRIFSQEE